MLNPADWEQMPFFLAVAREGTLRGAAEALGTSHVRVNRHLNALEAAYGVALVRRSRSGATLTAAGEHLLPLAEEAEAAFIQARRSLQGLDKQMQGDLKFSVSGPLGYQIAAPILAEFSRLHPGVNLIIHVSTEFEDPKLIDTDVSLRMLFEVTDDAIVKKLFPIGIGTFANKDYIATHFPKSGSKGEGLTWVGAGTPERPAWIDGTDFPQADRKHVVKDPMMFLEMVSNGAGITKIAAFLAQSRPELAIVPGTSIEDGPPLCILIHPEIRKTTRVRRFVDYLETELRRIRPIIQGKVTSLQSD